MTSTDALRKTGWVPNAADSFGARLALIRQRMGWGNVKEAAEAVDVPVESWRGWERDNREPRNYLAICCTISDATGVDAAWLMTGQEPREVADTSPKRRTRGRTDTFSCNTRGLRTRLHRPHRTTAGAA